MKRIAVLILLTLVMYQATAQQISRDELIYLTPALAIFKSLAMHNTFATTCPCIGTDSLSNTPTEHIISR